MNSERLSKGLAVVSLLAGLWVIASPYVLPYDAPVAYTSHGIIGSLVVVLSAVSLVMGRHDWTAWLRAAFGGYLMASPGTLGYAGENLVTHNDLAMGLLILALAVADLLLHAGTPRSIGATFASAEPDPEERRRP